MGYSMGLGMELISWYRMVENCELEFKKMQDAR